MRGTKHTIEDGSTNRKMRRMQGKLAGIKITGVQDRSVATHQLYYIPLERKSRAGVIYQYYKKVVDLIGLDKK